VIYQDPLAYLLGLEGIALLDAWAGDHDRAFTEARLDEIRRLLDDEKLRDRGVVAERVGTVLAYQQWAAGYARRGYRVIGVDGSADMLAYARRRVPAGEFHVGELDRLPLPDDSVDVIVCALALVHVPHLQPVLAECARVLRPGGDLVISDMHHEQVTRGSVVTARRPAGKQCIAATYRHPLGDYLRAALSLGLHVPGCEEPGARQPGEQPDEPLPEPATGIGDWKDWPFSLMDYLPSVARASHGRRPQLVIWHFQQPVA
jgi:SAM-dependent methyltransferase